MDIDIILGSDPLDYHLGVSPTKQWPASDPLSNPALRLGRGPDRQRMTPARGRRGNRRGQRVGGRLPDDGIFKIRNFLEQCVRLEWSPRKEIKIERLPMSQTQCDCRAATEREATWSPSEFGPQPALGVRQDIQARSEK